MGEGIDIADIRLAASALRNGHLVAFPTETVYGLGADATNPDAISRVFSVKGRPANHPLIVHIARKENMDYWGSDIPAYAVSLAGELWPGPMTLIVKKSPQVSPLVTGGQDTVGIRVPDHPVAQALLAEFMEQGGAGIVAPSANRFGRVSPTTADAVRAELADPLEPKDVIVDGGECAIGVESTIIDCTGALPSIARPGAVTADMISAITGLEVVPFSATIRVSGSLASHYAPSAQLVLDEEVQPGDGFLALSHHPTPPGAIRLIDAATPADFAHHLYGALRRADEAGIKRIVAISPEGDDIAHAIRDRLQRARSTDR